MTKDEKYLKSLKINSIDRFNELLKRKAFSPSNKYVQELRANLQGPPEGFPNNMPVAVDGGLGGVPLPKGYNGNIDLDNRKIYKHPDGYIQTEDSLGVGFDPGDNYNISIPTIVNGKPVSDKKARQHFMNTGEHLGVDFREEGESIPDFYKRTDAKSNMIHERQAEFYKDEVNKHRLDTEGKKLYSDLVAENQPLQDMSLGMMPVGRMMGQAAKGLGRMLPGTTPVNSMLGKRPMFKMEAIPEEQVLKRASSITKQKNLQKAIDESRREAVRKQDWANKVKEELFTRNPKLRGQF